VIELLVEPDRHRPCLIHRDVAGENLLVRHGRIVAIVDWETAAGGDPAFDIARFHFAHRNRECLEALLAGYGAGTGGDFRSRILGNLALLVVQLYGEIMTCGPFCHSLKEDLVQQVLRILATPPGQPWQAYAGDVVDV
jgi:hypothetical protein